MNFWSRTPKPFGTVTADRRNVVITIDKARADPRLIAALTAANDGDWGGADYPVAELSEQVCGKIADLICAEVTLPLGMTFKR